MSSETKTITERLAERPDEDVTEFWAHAWEVLSTIKDRIEAELGPIRRHEASEGLESWEAPNGSYEGSLNCYVSDREPGGGLGGEGDDRPSIDWFVHSWIGNRKGSILDMNINVWLGPEVDVPHLCIVYGAVPQLFHYSDLFARRDPMIDVDYVRRYYDDANDDFLAFRADDRFEFNVSHGAYMRAVASPVMHSYMTERTDEMIEVVDGYVMQRFERWLDWVKNAPIVPREDREALRARDRQLREYCYTLDPMNALSEKFMGPELTTKLIDVRYGAAQIHEGNTA